MESKTHFIAMAGLHGCLPNFCASVDTLQEAVDCLADVHELGKARKADLKRSLYLEMKIKRDGNEYCEIVQCDCEHPEDHGQD